MGVPRKVIKTERLRLEPTALPHAPDLQSAVAASRAELGPWPPFAQEAQGYVTEAGQAIVAFSFGTLSLERLELVAGVENHASNRVAEKLGIRREGLMRGAGFTPVPRYDCYIYGLLLSDPRPSGLAQHQPDQLLDQVDQEQSDPDHQGPFAVRITNRIGSVGVGHLAIIVDRSSRPTWRSGGLSRNGAASASA